MQLQDFYRHLEEHPDDWEYRSIFADWLYDYNNPLEVAQRYLIQHKKHPMYLQMSDRSALYILGLDDTARLGRDTYRIYKKCILPETLFKQIKSSHSYSGDVWKYYETMFQAEVALAHAITRILPTS